MPEINNLKEIKNEKLVEAIQLMKKRDIPLTRSEMLTQLVASQLLAPAIIEDDGDVKLDENNNRILSQNSKVKFHVLQDQNGNKYLPAFTSDSEFKKWKDKQQNTDEVKSQVILMRFEDYANIIANANPHFAGFTVDPFGVNMIFPTQAIMALKQQKDALQAIKNKNHADEAMANGLGRYNIKKGTKVVLGEPKEFPQELADAVKEHLSANESSVKRAYLQLMTQDDKRQSYLLVLDTESPLPPIFERIAEVAKPHLKKLNLDIMPANSELGKTVVEHAKPFYEKN